MIMNDQSTVPTVRYFDEISEGMSGEFSKMPDQI